jgi:3-methyladenine DNA glycosylase AlkD
MLAVAEILLHDKHELVNKAAGWMLRFAGDKNQKKTSDISRRPCAIHAARHAQKCDREISASC